jgi:hypothetical protein
MGLDIGPQARETFARTIENSRTILWNGPMGVFEFPNFAKGTIRVAEAVVKAPKKAAFRSSAAAIRRRPSTTWASANRCRTYHRRRRPARIHGRQGTAGRKGLEG